MKRHEQVALIALVPLFSTLPEDELEQLADTLKPHEFNPGELLLREGASDDRFYILLDGEAEVIKALGTPDERLLAVRPPGTLFGEMSLFDPEGRHTASVRSRTPVLTLEMTKHDFDDILHRRPALAYGMVRQMSRRLEESENTTILELREKNMQLTQAYDELKAAQEQLVIKERLEKELAIARDIQEGILPDVMPQFNGFDIGALTVPARAVGGDYYDFLLLDEDHLGLVVGDACDKGIPAALYIAITNSLMHAEAWRNTSPKATLRVVNQHLLDMNHSGMFVTLLYGIVDISGRFDYCRAGHPYPVVMDENGSQVTTITSAGMPLGISTDIKLESRSVTIPQGGLAVIFSDGLIEAMDSEYHEFGTERLVMELPGISHLPASEICAQIWQRIQEFSGNQPQSDDFTVVVVKRTK
jgi:sigma-B regulation protein RsbU (phosphoserine phosphatase)